MEEVQRRIRFRIRSTLQGWAWRVGEGSIVEDGAGEEVTGGIMMLVLNERMDSN